MQKEKRLKDILRSGNCIVKKFQKHHNDDLGHSIFFARVELKLVSRVLNMSRLTRDQLVWCQENLDQINIVSRKIQVEPSFFLFPCWYGAASYTMFLLSCIDVGHSRFIQQRERKYIIGLGLLVEEVINWCIHTEK